MNEQMTPIVPAKMKLGLNYGWYLNKYGDSVADGGMPADFEQFVAHWKPLGVRLIRFFVLSDLNLYGRATWSGGKSPIEMELVAWPIRAAASVTFTPDATKVPAIRAGFKQMLAVAKKHDIKVIPSLVDFFAFNLNPKNSAGKYEMLTNAAYRKKFFDDVFEPLLTDSEAFREQILAWEVMNEPRWVDRDHKETSYSLFSPRVPYTNVYAFLKEGLDRLWNHSLPSSVGHNAHQDMARYPTGDVAQFHYYPFKSEPLPSYSPGKAALVGEISCRAATLPATDWSSPGEADLRAWPELAGKDKASAKAATFERLKLLNKRGYVFAILWPDVKDQPALAKFSADAKAGILEYLKL